MHNLCIKLPDDLLEVFAKLNSSLQEAVAELGEKSEVFLKDLKDNPKLIDLFNENINLFGGWKRLSNLFPMGSKFITDAETLEKVSKLATDGSTFRNKLGSNWSEVLDDIIKNASDLKCNSCGNAGRVGRSSMDQYLEDVSYFVSNFNVKPGGKGEVFFNWMRNATNPTSGQLDELHQTIRDFAKRGIKESDVKGMGKQFDRGTKRYDLRKIDDKYTEYKNKDFAKNPLTAGSDDVDQFINGYLKNIESMDDLEWKAGFDKLKSAWSSEADALNKMKGQWKSVFESKADEIFEVNPTLFNKLKLKDGTLVSDSELFREFLEEITETNKLFDFIKVE